MCKSVITTSTGGGKGWGALLRSIIGSFPPGFSNPDLISDQKILFSITIFRPGARFSKVPVTLRARNQIFKSKYKE